MTYVDSSVALAWILGEDVRPRQSLWQQLPVSSRLLEYELWNRIHAHGKTASHGKRVRALLTRVDLHEMTPGVLVRALDAFPTNVKTLDGLHLATAVHVREQGRSVRVASYDERFRAAARALGFDLFPLDAEEE